MSIAKKNSTLSKLAAKKVTKKTSTPKHSVIRDMGIDLDQIRKDMATSKLSVSDVAIALISTKQKHDLQGLGLDLEPSLKSLAQLQVKIDLVQTRLLNKLENADTKIALRMERNNKKAQWAVNKHEREAGKATRKANRKASLQAKMDKLTKQMEDL